MASKVLLLVKYGSDIGAEVGIFKKELGSKGWKKGLVEGTFRKDIEGTLRQIREAAQKDVADAATQADFSRTFCEIEIISDEAKFSWNWDNE